MNELEPEHHVIARSLATLIDPEEHDSGLAHEPGYNTKKEGMTAEGFFQIYPTFELQAGTLVGQQFNGANRRRQADICVVVVRDSVIDGETVVDVYQPSAALEYLVESKTVNGMTYNLALDKWSVNTSSGTVTKLYRPQGFGPLQDDIWDWCMSNSSLPFAWNASQIPVGSWMMETGSANFTIEPSFGAVRRIPMWTITHSFNLTSPVTAGPDFDFSEWALPEYKDGVLQPYLYRCRITGRPTTEKYTRVRWEHVDMPVPAAWAGATETSTWFSGRPNLTSVDVGLTPQDIAGMRNTAGADVPVANLEPLANQLVDNWARGLAGQVMTTQRNIQQQVRYIYGSRTQIPVFRLVAGVTEIQSQDQNFNTGIIIPFSDEQGADVRNVAVSEVLRAGYHEYPIDSSPVRTHYVPRHEDDFKFFPFGPRGAGLTAYSGFVIVGACTGTNVAPTVAVTPLPRNFRIRFFGKVEHFNLRDGHNRDRHCPQFKAICGTVAKLIGNTPGGAKTAKHTPKSKKAIVNAAISATSAAALPTPTHSSNGTPTVVNMTPPKTPSEQTGIVATVENIAHGAVGIADTAATTVGELVGDFNRAAGYVRGRSRSRSVKNTPSPGKGKGKGKGRGSSRNGRALLWMR